MEYLHAELNPLRDRQHAHRIADIVKAAFEVPGALGVHEDDEHPEIGEEEPALVARGRAVVDGEQLEGFGPELEEVVEPAAFWEGVRGGEGGGVRDGGRGVWIEVLVLVRVWAAGCW